MPVRNHAYHISHWALNFFLCCSTRILSENNGGGLFLFLCGSVGPWAEPKLYAKGLVNLIKI